MKRKVEVVVCLVDYHLAGKFFFRLARSDNKKKYIFITTSVTFFLFLKFKRIEVHLINRFSNGVLGNKLGIESLSRTREVKLKLMGVRAAANFSKKISSKVCLITKKHPESRITFFTWNGNNILGEVIRCYTEKHNNVASLFFEISNLHGKLFIDPAGVNASASIYNEPFILNDYTYDKAAFDIWKKSYIEEKLIASTVPQVKKVKELKLWHLFDFLFYVTVGYATFPKGSVANKLSSFFKLKKKKKTQQDNVLPDEYVFFPMQVSSDTQIKLNSNTNNYDALKYLIESESSPIVIKPHPAEPDFDYINDILLEHRDRVFLTTNNTYELIKNAKKVVTINSTVGFEAMLFEKEVIFLGRSFYKNFTPDLSGAYVMSYLVDINFFDSHSGKIPPQKMSEIYGRAKWT